MSAATAAPVRETSAPSLNGAIDADRPSPNGANGGNPAPLPRNPFARRLAAFRQALSAAVTEDDIRAIAAKLLELARNGDVPAARLLLAYAIGRPATAAEPDTLDAHELATMAAQTASAEVVETALHGMPAELAAQTLRIAIPAQSERLRQVMAAKLRKQEKRAKRRARKAQR